MLTRGRRESCRNRAEELLLGSASAERLLLMLRRILTNRQLKSLGIAAESVGLADDFLVREAADQCDGQLPKARWESQSSVFETISRLDSTLSMGNTLLRDTDVVSMARSQEVRVPYLDRRLFDYVAALPVGAKFRRGASLKSLLREACRDLIPDPLINRPKTGFTLPVDRWMHGPLRESCEACIRAAADSGVLAPEGVRALWAEFIGSEAHVHWVRPMTLIAVGNYLMQIKKITAQ
jgi:asparagine synthase (glutamine-hydrolysing)